MIKINQRINKRWVYSRIQSWVRVASTIRIIITITIIIQRFDCYQMIMNKRYLTWVSENIYFILKAQRKERKERRKKKFVYENDVKNRCVTSRRSIWPVGESRLMSLYLMIFTIAFTINEWQNVLKQSIDRQNNSVSFLLFILTVVSQ